MTRPETLSCLRQLHDELAAINEELASHGDVDCQIIELLGELVTDINVLCDRHEKSVEHNPNSPEHLALADRIERLASNHPRITKFLMRMTEVLRQI
jgi:hypothetical protein